MAVNLLAPPALAAGVGALYNKVLHTYQADGRIPPCEFTSPELATTLNEVDAYGQEYFADFIGAINTALTARASGACSGGHQHAVSVTARTNRGSSPSPGGPALPSSITAPTRSGLPLPLILLLALGVLAGGSAALIQWLRSRGGTGRTAGWRHGAAEARYQAAGAWLRWRDGRRR